MQKISSKTDRGKPVKKSLEKIRTYKNYPSKKLAGNVLETNGRVYEASEPEFWKIIKFIPKSALTILFYRSTHVTMVQERISLLIIGLINAGMCSENT